VMRPPCRRVELHHLPTGQMLAWEHTAESLARQMRRAEDIAAECAAADERYRVGTHGEQPRPAVRGLPDDQVDEVFPPRPGPACGWCAFRACCPEGSAASEPRRPWDGLGAGDSPAGGSQADAFAANPGGVAAAPVLE
jgi:putative RecB family exonuclease